MTGCDLLSFLDVYSGYCQISMAREDKEKTSFTTLVGTYYYVRMLFGLKNAGPTFQRTMRISLRDLQSHNVEAYDGIVVENRQQETSLLDLSEAFSSLRITS